jgi:transglutaminase-like putative cysteine protease/tetratricopeptide (TPR) repeat protein
LGFVTRWNLIGTGKCTADRLDDISHRTTLVSTPLAAVSIPGLEEEVCVATTIYSDVDRAVALRFSVAGTGSLYVNGGVAADSVGGTAVAFDQHSVGVRINAGWNVIALEVRGSANRQFALRVTHPGGEGIVVSSDPTRVHAATATAEQIAVADLLSEAEAKANAKKTPDAFDTLAEIADLRALADAADRRQTAALNAPTANRWLAVARECDEASCMFSALNKARQLDPQNANVLGDLADYYTERGQLEKSRDLLRQALAADPGNYVLAKRLADVNASAGSMTTALSEYRNLETSGIHSIWLERELGLRYEAAGLNDRATVLLNEAWRLSFDDESVRSALQQLAEAKGDSAELQKLARAAVALHPEDVTASFALAQLENSPAKFERAAASANATGDNDLRVRYANLLAFAGKPREASAELALAAQQDVRIQLPPTTSGTDPDSEYLENAAALAAKAQRTPPGGSANVVTLADVTVERMLASGQTSQHVQQVFYIATQRGARDYSNRTIQYSETSQRLTVASARVYTRDGRVISAEDEGESSVADTNISMYYDTRSRSFRFPSLQKGDVIELEYRISPRSNLNPYGSYFGSLVAFQGALPQQLHRYVLVAPASRKLKMVQERMPAAEVVTNNGETTYRWEMRDIAPLPNEPRGPSLTEIAPYLSVSTFTDWTQLGHWYAQMIAPQFALDAPLREALTQITKNAGTELEKVRAIHEFVVRNTHYVAMEFGIYSYKPYPVSQVYARRFGDCKDKASLMIALMRAAGIDAELALVRTRKLGDVSEQATNISVFNHAVAYIPKYDLWLDGTAEYAGFHELPLDDQGAMALTVNLNGATNLRRIPVTLPMQNYTHRVVRAEVQTDGKIVFNGSAYTRGEDAPGLRREYEVAERQRDTVRANLAQVYPSVQVDSVHVDGTHDLEHDIKVNFSGSLDTFAGKKSLDLAPSWLPHKYVNSLAPLTTRTEQLQLPAPWTTEEELHFTIPQDANLDRVPENWHYDTPFGTAVIRYELRGRELIVTTSVQFRKLRIEPTEYSGFRDFCRNVEKAFHQEIKVRLAS